MSRPLMLALTGALVLVGCGKKTTGTVAAAASKAGSSAITAQLPDGKDAAAYAKRLVGTTVTNWEPTDGDGARLKYKEMTFDGTGHWTASAVLKAGFEEMDCTESGTWLLDRVDSATDGSMDWTIKQTNCGGRDEGHKIRVQMLMPTAGEYQINFR